MKVLLTGITGNLGYEIAQNLKRRGISVLPIVRKLTSLEKLGFSVENAVESDLAQDTLKVTSGEVDYIIHSAGNVHFERSGSSNSEMMRSIIRVAEDLKVPIYYVSTSFLWREPGSIEVSRNAYESDKSNAEKILRDSGVPNTIFRPSVLAGNSESGKLINWTGYYLLVSKFLETAKVSNATKIRFPLLTGSSNMVPVDQVAETITETVTNNILGKLVYVTNPEPPSAQWVLNTTLKFLKIKERFEFLDIDFANYKKLERSREEEILYVTGKHFSPYWSLAYNFPKSEIKDNLITEEYLKNTLRSFQISSKIEQHE